MQGLRTINRALSSALLLVGLVGAFVLLSAVPARAGENTFIEVTPNSVQAGTRVTLRASCDNNNDRQANVQLRRVRARHAQAGQRLPQAGRSPFRATRQPGDYQVDLRCQNNQTAQTMLTVLNMASAQQGAGDRGRRHRRRPGHRLDPGARRRGAGGRGGRAGHGGRSAPDEGRLLSRTHHDPQIRACAAGPRAPVSGPGMRCAPPAGWLARASGRLRRVAGQAVSASVATTDPDARPLPPSRPGAPLARHRFGTGPGLPVLAIAAVMVLIVAMLGVEQVTGISVLPDRITAGLRPPPKKFPVLPASRPTDLAIGEIDLRAPVHDVGIAPDGTIAVPDVARAQEAGWYDQGPTPGQYGPAVIVGHVDTTTGPAVFHQLRELRSGDRIEVTRSDHRVAIFEVDSVERFDKGRLPVDEVYGDFSRPSLRLITCGGRWVGGETGYSDNLVVFASLVKARDG